jgi:hypothetical protein
MASLRARLSAATSWPVSTDNRFRITNARMDGKAKVSRMHMIASVIMASISVKPESRVKTCMGDRNKRTGAPGQLLALCHFQQPFSQKNGAVQSGAS